MSFRPTNRRHPVQQSFESANADPTWWLHPQGHLIVKFDNFCNRNTQKLTASCHCCHPLKKKTLIPIQISFQRAWSSTTAAGRQSAFMTYHRHAPKKGKNVPKPKGSACTFVQNHETVPKHISCFSQLQEFGESEWRLTGLSRDHIRQQQAQ